MAVSTAPNPASDRDLASVAEARALARRAKAAQARAGRALASPDRRHRRPDGRRRAPHAEALARLAVEETGFGVVADKVQKNLFSSDRVHAFIKPMKTVGVVARLEDKRVIEIAEPFGVVAAIVPSTNPTSTAIYKILIALKARCAIVISPHPSAARCITRVAEIMAEAATRAGAPEGAIGWLTTVTLEGTQELMKQREVSVILATGGMGLVRAAYSAGKPAYGVGPGNAPCYIEASADLAKAAQRHPPGQELRQRRVVLVAQLGGRRPVRRRGSRPPVPGPGRALPVDGRGRPARQGAGHAAAPAKSRRWSANRRMVIAEKVGLRVPAGTRVLIARLQGVGRDHPLSIEKLCPVLSFYVVKDWREGCERCKEILRYGGMGHTMSIHSRNDAVILEFGLHKPAYRICVNTPTTHGSIGLTTGLDPAMTLGCGGFGGNITSDNISPRHLLNIKRLAYELRPATAASTAVAAPAAMRPAESSGISSAALGARIDQYLKARGFSPARPTAPAPPPAATQPASVQLIEPADAPCRKAGRLRVRRRRPAGDSGGSDADNF